MDANKFNVALSKAVRSALLRLPSAGGNEAVNFALDNFRNQSLLENLLSAQLPERSAVRQLRGGTDSVRVTPEGDLKHIDVKPMFCINMGERGLAFPADHPYFKEAPQRAEILARENSGFSV